MSKAQPPGLGVQSSDATLSQSRLMRVLQAFATAPARQDIPKLVVSEAVAAMDAAGGVVALVDGDRIEPLASRGCTGSQEASYGSLRVGDLSRPLTWAATTGEPAWLPSLTDAAAVFPHIAAMVSREGSAYAVLPLRAAGALLGVMGITWAQPHAFTASDRRLLLALADICALHLHHWRTRDRDGNGPPAEGSPSQPSPAVALAPLVQALTGSDTIEDLARAIAEQGATAVGAAFSNIAVLEPRTTGDVARLYHLSSLVPTVAERYQTIPVDDLTSLGAAMSGRRDVWLGDLGQIGAQFPLLLADTAAAGLAATASLALIGRADRVIGALGLGWETPQAFPATQRDELRLVANLVADALERAQQLAAERAALERAERLQRILTALVASASLREVTDALFVDGKPPCDATAARLALFDEERPDQLVTVATVGLPEGAQDLWQAASGTAPSPLSDTLISSVTVYLPTLADLALQDPHTRESLEQAGLRCWVGLPLRSGSRTIGALVLAFSREDALEPSDLTALTELGTAISEAISRAVERDSDHDLAVLVQRSLLAEPLPELCHAEVSARYLPANPRYGIGGDWYDALPLPGGRTLLMIGDVGGHGAGAAVAMGQIRAAARALAPTHEPARLLQELDRFVNAASTQAMSTQAMVTVAAVLLDPDRGTLTYSLAGHPPPMLHRPGSAVTYLQHPEPPLGVRVPSRTQHTVDLPADSTVVLYTDGLVERRGEHLDAGLHRLATAIAEGPVGDPAGLCASLLDTCLRDVPRTDDTAVVCAVITPHRAPRPE